MYESEERLRYAARMSSGDKMGVIEIEMEMEIEFEECESFEINRSFGQKIKDELWDF